MCPDQPAFSRSSFLFNVVHNLAFLVRVACCLYFPFPHVPSPSQQVSYISHRDVVFVDERPGHLVGTSKVSKGADKCVARKSWAADACKRSSKIFEVQIQVNNGTIGTKKGENDQ